MLGTSSTYLTLILGLAFWFGCEPNGVDEDRTASTLGDASAVVEVYTRPLDLSQLSGYWVTSDYLHHLQRTGSPRAADKETWNLTTLAISFSSDTLFVHPTPMCATEWEQERAFVQAPDGSIREIGRRYPADPLEHCGQQCETLRLESRGGDHRLILTSPTRSGLSASYAFLAPLHAHEAPHYALAAIAQERFLTGTFRNRADERIVFTSDGHVSGLHGASRYIVSTYFCEEMSVFDSDIVILNPDIDSRSLLPDGALYAANRLNGQIALSRVDWPEGFGRDWLNTSISIDSVITLSPADH